MQYLETLLSPIIWLMELILSAYTFLTGSVGISIILLSATFSALLLPLQRIALRAEQSYARKASIVNEEIKALRAKGLKGEALFEATEAVYSRYNYHPIHALKGSASFAVLLPVLLSGLILFRSSSLIQGQSFLFVPDLSKPDALLFGVNLLPFVMFGVTMLDAFIRYRTDPAARNRFLFVSVVLLVLVYSMPAALVLYWLVSNVGSFASVVAGRREAGP